jgi:hypothetical protein
VIAGFGEAQLGTLDDDRPVREVVVAAGVVDVQMAVHDEVDVVRRQADDRQGVGDGHGPGLVGAAGLLIDR